MDGEYVLYDDHAAIVAKLSPIASDRQGELDEAEGEAHGWNRLLSNYQGAERGWFQACESILDMATAAWRAGDEAKAKLLRALQDDLRKHPALIAIKKDQSDAYASQVRFEQEAENIRNGATPS